MMPNPKERIRMIITGVNQLKNIGPGSNAPTEFIYEKSPLEDVDDDEDEDAAFKKTFNIKGQLLPQSNLYKDSSLGVQIVIGSEFPFKPPKVEMTMPMFHPNIKKDGEVCIDLLAPNSARWTASTSLVTVIEEVTKVIDEPATDLVQHTEAASLWDTDRQEYERRVSELLRKHAQPR